MGTTVILEQESGRVRELPLSTPIYSMPGEEAMREFSWFGEARIAHAHLATASCGTLADAKLGDHLLIADARRKGRLAGDQLFWIVDNAGIRNEIIDVPRADMVPLREALVVCVTGFPKSRELRTLARDSAELGNLIRVERRPHHANPSTVVESVITTDEQGRPSSSAQAMKGDVVWGEWSPESQAIVLDDQDDEGRTVRVHLDGRREVVS